LAAVVAEAASDVASPPARFDSSYKLARLIARLGAYLQLYDFNGEAMRRISREAHHNYEYNNFVLRITKFSDMFLSVELDGDLPWIHTQSESFPWRAEVATDDAPI
jgi:hypothetical protein